MLREEKIANKKAGIEAPESYSESSDNSESNSNFRLRKSK